MGEGAAEVTVVHPQRLAQGDAVFHRHARALREILQRRVSGIAEERGAAVGPLPDRLAVGSGPALPALGQIDQLASARADAFEVALHLLAAAFAHAPLLLLTAVERDDHVVLLAAA